MGDPMDDYIEDPIFDHIDSLPRGETLNIACTYEFSRGKPRPDEKDIPSAWRIDPIYASDEEGSREVAAAGFKVVPTYIGTREDGVQFTTTNPDLGEPGAYIFLRNPVGQIVATWDEGRWWTANESSAFNLLLTVPAAAEMSGTFGLGWDVKEPGVEESE